MINIQALEKSFGDKKVLDRLTFSLVPGEIYGLLGPNGSGKSTTINLICNLLDVDDGAIWIDGKAPSDTTKSLIGVAPQEISLYKDLTCQENLHFFANLYGVSRKKRTENINDLIDTFQLHEHANTKVGSLSGGWQRRVNIAVAMVHAPSILILDEPTAGLDVEARYELWRVIEQLKMTGMTILLTTHYLEEAETLCSRIGILQHGRIVAEGAMDELCTLVTAQALAVLETNNKLALCQKASSLGWDYREYGGKLTLLLPQHFTLKQIVEHFDGLPLSSIDLQKIRLEHVYFEVTQDRSNSQRIIA